MTDDKDRRIAEICKQIAENRARSDDRIFGNDITERLRGKYPIGPRGADGEPEFGWRCFATPPIQHEAADEIESLRTRIEELEAAQDWQPIETAPKDGTMVFVWHPIDVRQRHASFESSIRKAKFLPELDEWQVESVGGYPPPVVTHWRPLFDPPKGTGDER